MLKIRNCKRFLRDWLSGLGETERRMLEALMDGLENDCDELDDVWQGAYVNFDAVLDFCKRRSARRAACLADMGAPDIICRETRIGGRTERMHAIIIPFAEGRLALFVMNGKRRLLAAA